MEQRVSLISLGVADLRRARTFYEQLGWTGQEVEETVFFQAGGVVVVLWGWEKLALDCGIPGGPQKGFQGMTIAHNVRSRDEVDEVLSIAELAGAVLTRAAADTFYGGYAGVFSDPDGHAWEIAYNPGFCLAKDGSITVPDFGAAVTARQLQINDPDQGRMLFDAIAAGPETGELVLLLHGFPQTKRSFQAQVEALGKAGYRAVAVDQRGYSPGARPPGVEAYRTERLTADVLALADALGASRFHLVGHDFGAVVGWQVAARHGHRLLSYTALSVGHPLAYVEALADPDGDQLQRSGYFDWFIKPETDKELGDYDRLHALYLAAGLNEEAAVADATALGSPEAIGAGLNWYRASGLHQIADLPPVTVPVLFIWSTEDPALGPASAYGTERHVSGPYRFVVIEGVDHWLPEHATDRVNQLLVEHLAANGFSARAADSR